MKQKKLSKDIRKLILKTVYESGHGHMPTCFSIIEMLLAIYSTIKHNPKNPYWRERDTFILSKGHASLALYTVLAKYGYFSEKILSSYGAYNSILGCHADRNKVPGVECSTGSLGHGIGVAAGVALANKLNSSKNKVYVIIGDGESNEGTVWETMLIASDRQLNNLIVMYDDNKSQERCLEIKNPKEKFRSFGANVIEVNGHSIVEIKKALKNTHKTKPTVIICKTLKGFGSKTLIENKFAWHRRSPNSSEYKNLMKEIENA